MEEKFKKQTIAKNERAREEVKALCDENSIDYVAKLFSQTKEDINQMLSGEKKINEFLFGVICEKRDCSYEYLLGQDNARNEKERNEKVKTANEMLEYYKKPRVKYGLEKNSSKSRHQYQGTRAQMIMKEISDEKGVDYLVNELRLTSVKSVINMLNGNTAISKKHYTKLSELGNCTLDYLNGTSSVRNSKEGENIIKQQEETIKQGELRLIEIEKNNAKLSAMNNELKYVELLTDNAIDGLKKLKLNLESNINEIDDIIIGAKYADIVSYIISDVNLWLTLIVEVERLIETETNIENLRKFENQNNRNIDIDYTYPTKIEPKDIAIFTIRKAVTKSVKEYIRVKKEECGENQNNRNNTYSTKFEPEDRAIININKAVTKNVEEYIRVKKEECGAEEINLDIEEQKQAKEMLKKKNKDNNIIN